MEWDDLYYRFLQSYTRKVFEEVLFLIIQLLPYLITGIFVTAAIKRYTTAENLKRFIAGKNISLSIIIAALLGIISPLGSYVVIPLSAALIMAGLPLAPVIAFMVASPLINPGLFFLTLGAFGPGMAVMRCLGAICIGAAAGFITHYTKADQYQTLTARREKDPAVFMVKYTFWQDVIRYSKYISKHFLLGIFAAALTKVLIPVSWISGILDRGHVVSIFAATLAGVPLYSCGGAAIPVMQQLADLGIDKGAILAFFLSGPATKIANIVLLVSAFRKKIIFIYIILSIAGAILMGFLYHYF